MITVRNDVTVEGIDIMGGDRAIVDAARVSTGASYDETLTVDKMKGLINYLMSNRHGTPFEHSSMTFYIEAPIFVFREFHRHRIGWSYNEMSGRYTELDPVFYIPNGTRPLFNVGTSARPVMAPAPPEVSAKLSARLTIGYIDAWERYQESLADGVAKEVARLSLPVSIYSKMYATCNPRSLMAFLSLRTDEPTSAYPSKPQYEIELVARQLEEIFMEQFPMTYETFVLNGRVGP